MSRSKAVFAGLLAGLVAGIAMTAAMLLLASFGIATPLAIIGDRLSVFISPGPFLSIMGRVGGYNHLKQLGVGSTMAGQVLVGALGGAIFGLVMRRNPARRVTPATIGIFVVLPILAAAVALWPVLGTSYRGLPIDAARLVTLVGFALAVFAFERTLVTGFHFLTRAKTGSDEQEFTPAIGRRALILGGLGVLVAGGGVGLMRKLYRAATFSYDGTQYKGRVVQPITPNELFYCVTKNVVDPRVNVHLWHLEVNGVPLPHRHGYPARVIVPGYFGEKHVKWLTRIEVTDANAKGFYETQGWGPDFIVPTRSRIDVPDHESQFSINELREPIEVKGVAFGGDRGISRVELSFDDGETWDDADIYYTGGDLAWSLWSARGGWMPDEPDDYIIVVRATDGEGDVQEWEEDRSPFSGVTGFHKIVVHITA